jgi:hypothetical protein
LESTLLPPCECQPVHIDSTNIGIINETTKLFGVKKIKYFMLFYLEI